MKKGFKLFGLLAVAFFFLNTDTVNKLDLQPAKNIEGRNFDFRYTGTLEVGDGVMPLIGQLSKDGKNMYITSQNSRGGKMLYKMTRDELGSAFGAPEKVEGILNAGGYDVLMPSLSADENVLVFVNSENGMQNGNDLFIASKDENGEYGNIRNLKEINHPSLSDAYPWLSADGLRLYFTKQKGAKITFWTAERKDLESEFSGLTEMGLELPKISNNMSCMLSADELEVYALSGENIYYAKRSTVDSPFHYLLRLPTLQTTAT